MKLYLCAFMLSWHGQGQLYRFYKYLGGLILYGHIVAFWKSVRILERCKEVQGFCCDGDEHVTTITLNYLLFFRISFLTSKVF